MRPALICLYYPRGRSIIERDFIVDLHQSPGPTENYVLPPSVLDQIRYYLVIVAERRSASIPYVAFTIAVHIDTNYGRAPSRVVTKARLNLYGFRSGASSGPAKNKYVFSGSPSEAG